MYNIKLDGTQLSTIIINLEVEEQRIYQYYTPLLHHQGAEISAYDKKRLENINEVIDILKKVRGGN